MATLESGPTVVEMIPEVKIDLKDVEITQVERSAKYEHTYHKTLSLVKGSELMQALGKENEEEKPKFVKAPHTGLTTKEVEKLTEEYGKNEIVENEVPLWYVYLMLLVEPMPIMIWFAIIIEGAIQDFMDMGILLGIQFLNATLSFHELTKAGNAVAALKNSLKPSCSVKRDGVWLEKYDATNLVPGDLVKLFIGGAVPADCYLNEGQLDIDQSAMTGESLPVVMYEGDIAKMGSNVMRGECEATVESTGKNTFFGKTAAMLQGDSEQSNLQKLLLRIMKILVIMCVLLCGIVFAYLMGKGEDFVDALAFTVVLLVASVPLAIEIVTTTTLALGSQEMIEFGAIVSRLAAIEEMAGMNILCSDKTGTLTKNKMEIQEDTPTYQPKMDQRQILLYAAMAAKWKESPKDALDTLVLGPGGADLNYLNEKMEQTEYMPFDPKVKRTEGTIKVLETGKIFKVTKGAPNIIAALDDDISVRDKVNTKVAELAVDGIRSLAVAKTDESGAWKMLGMITFLDPPRSDTAETIRRSVENGVPVKMITGDHLNIAIKTAKDLGLKNAERIEGPTRLPLLTSEGKPPSNLLSDFRDIIEPASGFAQVFPEHKFLIVEAYRQMGYKVGMTGDGVNDAPALKRADIGVAVMGATDAARAAADIILTREGLSTIVDGITVSRRIFQRIKNFIIYRIAATLQILLFNFIAVLAFKPNQIVTELGCSSIITAECIESTANWPRFFGMPVLLLILITLLNDGTLISIGYDNVTPSQHPEIWNLPVLFTVASLFGLLGSLSTLLVLAPALYSWQPGATWQNLGMPAITYGQITTIVFMKVSISSFLSLFSARTGNNFFWKSMPAPVLLVASGVAMFITTMLATFWPSQSLSGIPILGMGLQIPKYLSAVIWLICIIWLFISDFAKVGLYMLLEKYNVFDINGTLAKENQAKEAARHDKLAEQARLTLKMKTDAVAH